MHVPLVVCISTESGLRGVAVTTGSEFSSSFDATQIGGDTTAELNFGTVVAGGLGAGRPRVFNSATARPPLFEYTVPPFNVLGRLLLRPPAASELQSTHNPASITQLPSLLTPHSSLLFLAPTRLLPPDRPFQSTHYYRIWRPLQGHHAQSSQVRLNKQSQRERQSTVANELPEVDTVDNVLEKLAQTAKFE